MIKAIFFDFDGVILESAQIKTRAFRQLFSRWPDKVDEIVAYHIRYAGVSRYVKFRHFYENILKQPYSKEIETEMARGYSKLVLDEVKKTPFVPGAKKFLETFKDKLLLFVVSATPQAELNDVVSVRKLSGYFKKVCGFPPEKEILLRNLMKEIGLTGESCVYVGDGQSDMEAAQLVGMPFVLRVTSENKELKTQVQYHIEDLSTLSEKLSEIKGGLYVK